MKPNNLYYRDILTILEPSQEYAKFYSTMYYLRRIAMHYGASYTGRKCSNKYIKDWAIAMGVTDDGQHHVNYYWIKRIAKKLVPSTADDLSENTYLRIISENITPTPVPIATTIKTFINNVEVDNTQTIPPTILSYADRENAVFKFVVTDEEDNPVEGYSIPFSVGGVDQTPMTTNANGEATYTYQSSGVGDTDVSINCSLVSKTYEVQDCLKYISSISQSFIGWYGLADLGSNLSDCDITFKMKSTAQRFRFDFGITNQLENKSRITLGTNDNGVLEVDEWSSGGSVTPHSISQTYALNSDISCQITRDNNQIIGKIDNSSVTVSDIANLRYIGITTWNTAKTVTITDLKVKPL